MKIFIRIILLLPFFLFTSIIFSQTTGKISGKVTDSETGEALIGANVLIEGSGMGAAASENGQYFILNISPGVYNIRFQMVGYGTKTIENIRVSVNRTTNVSMSLSQQALTTETVVVSADKLAMKKDQTSSIRNVSADQIEMLPVENIESIVSMQAGVVDGHFRGGRSTEVSYLVDGIQTDERFDRNGKTVEIETEAVQDLEVITGTFNAEYGRAMSGIVNVVTKDGGTEFKGSFSGHLSNYITSNSDVFIGLKNGDVSRNKDFKVSLSGPIYKDIITFFANYRYEDVKGYLNGINRFQVDNYTNFIERPEGLINFSTPWDAKIRNQNLYSEHTGDNSYVPMEWHQKTSFLGKLSFKPITNIRFSLMASLNGFGPGFENGNSSQSYQHAYKYKPTGRRTRYEKNQFYLFSLNHLLSNSIFYDFKVSCQEHNTTAYLYENPFDERYVSDAYIRTGGGFITGGQQKQYGELTQKDLNVKFDLTWQVNQNHSLKAGAIYTTYKIINDTTSVIDLRSRTGDPTYQSFYYDPAERRVIFSDYEPSLLPNSVIDAYERKPYEVAAYFQDKMEFDDLVVNLGIRYDYFNANTLYPSDLRNPDNLQDSKRLSEYLSSKPQKQISPRFGLSYKVGSRALLHFSYGHFFQMPPFYSMFQNHHFLIPTGDFETVHGNPNIKAERTVQYEMGLWQELIAGLGIELSVFYRDIYDLQSAIAVTTYSGRKYGVYSNKDYGNAKGFEFKIDYLAGPLSFYLNYTLQFTRGVADNPNANFDRLGQSIDPISRLTPLSWDQRNTANITVGYTEKNWGTTLTAYYNSGQPYTYSPILESTLAKQDIAPNSEHRPTTISVDLKSYYDIEIFTDIDIRLSLLVRNLLDAKNELFVNPTTGRAYTNVVRESDIFNFRSNYNDISDGFQNPEMFSAPREIKIGLGIQF